MPDIGAGVDQFFPYVKFTLQCPACSGPAFRWLNRAQDTYRHMAQARAVGNEAIWADEKGETLITEILI
jgi:hypothetical protein